VANRAFTTDAIGNIPHFQETEPMLPLLLAITPFPPELIEKLASTYEVIAWKDVADAPAFLASRGKDVRALITNGMVGVPAGMAGHLTGLGLIACNGVGYDAIDIAWARARGIAVSNTPDVLSTDVADLALALLLGAFRQLPAADRFVREGAWRKGAFPLARQLTGSRIGIVGLGRIGRMIAQRCAAFDTTVGYNGRTRQQGVPYEYFETPTALAAWADALIVVTPGGAETKHLISAQVLDALGANGVLVNVARGSVVDEAALVERLQSKRLAGAGLDVFANEPDVPEALLGLPHVALAMWGVSATVQTRRAMAGLVLDNLMAFAEGKALPTAVN
jgi:hydroxypyruvate reductase